MIPALFLTEKVARSGSYRTNLRHFFATTVSRVYWLLLFRDCRKGLLTN